MSKGIEKGLDRRDFLKAGTLASSAAAFGAFATAGNQAVAGSTFASGEAKLINAQLSEAEIAALPRVKQELVVSSPQIMYHFSIEFLELAVSCLGLGEGGCDCTALAMH